MMRRKGRNRKYQFQDDTKREADDEDEKVGGGDNLDTRNEVEEEQKHHMKRTSKTMGNTTYMKRQTRDQM